ncbi:PHP domain-containing protein [Halocatena salina]|uniref:PHP domain-containing protein n=1 Tax=Halocatena salina TaxID=2934340 RepID=A0A8U0A167_9EURY|nr:PHP domain-containing protein [Halocatena salina]UPM41727.1 PHP domain-containing protein [Halocatena salina]
MVVADLHVHTTNSDGALEPDAVPKVAAMAGVSVVAITDHDRLVPFLNAPVKEIGGVTVIHGIELRVERNGQQIDLLGYGVRPTEALCAEIDRLQENRIERANEIVERIERRTGVTLDIELQPGVGRPHIARAIEQSAIDCDYHAAFDRLIGDDCPCFVPRRVPSFERGHTLLKDACGLVSLAHPLRYDDQDRALSLAAALDGVEYHYDYGRDVDLQPVERTIRENDLVVTGGSDAHDRTLGRAGLSEAEYHRFRTRCRRD